MSVLHFSARQGCNENGYMTPSSEPGGDVPLTQQANAPHYKGPDTASRDTSLKLIPKEAKRTDFLL